VNYLAITQLTAKWLIEKKAYLDAVGAELERLSSADYLTKTVLSVGAFRAAASTDGRLLAIWNRDYLSNKGDESWGVIRLQGPYSLLSIYLPEVLERELQIIHQRIEGLLLDSRWIHHTRGDGIHTCIAGRGEDAREYRVMYGDRDLTIGATVSRAVVCLGPERENDGFVAAARHDFALLPQLARLASTLVSSSTLRPVAAASHFTQLHERFVSVSAEPAGVAAPALAVPSLTEEQQADLSFATEDWSYESWISADSPLTATQRRILESDIADRQPLRIAGAAGSGKTLLMMLLAIRMLRRAQKAAQPLRVLYVVHNAAMEAKVWTRFIELGAADFLEAGATQVLEVRTLFEYSRNVMEVGEGAVFDPDAQQSKEFQVHLVSQCLRKVLKQQSAIVASSSLLSEVLRNEELFPVFVSLTSDEIGLAIKGHDLGSDRKTYVGSERRLSRLHGILNHDERNVLFDVFEAYRSEVFESYEMFDTDDLAVSLTARLTTPLWTMQRRKLGYDYVFVDEMQLFNENERRIFPLLTRGTTSHVPVVLALDEAQQTRGVASAGLGLLGFDQLSDEALQSVHRSTHSILRLAFFVIQRTTDLFGSDFPDFTGTTQPVIPDSHRLALMPRLVRAGNDGVGAETVRQIRLLRKDNLRQIGIVCHAERYWEEISNSLAKAELTYIRLNQRGERIDTTSPLVALARPETVGGQEFDAVLAVGLEQGVVPPRVSSNQALSIALEQQALREIYVSFTRARYRLIVVNSHRSAPTAIIADAVRARFIEKWGDSGRRTRSRKDPR
jgi:superfamily I DNA/RNA helicase